MSNELSNKLIALRLKGSPADNDKVRLIEFRDFLAKVSDCLNKIDLKVSKRGKPSLYYRITDLQAKSASVTIEAVPYRPELDNSVLILDSFVEGSVLIQEKKQIPLEFDRELLEAFRGLTATLNKHVTSIQIMRLNKTFEITKQLESNIESILGEDIISEGSIEGFLEAVNVHHQNNFYIYPTITPTRIACIFPIEMLPEVGQALKRYVSVSGLMRYKKIELYPHQIDVREIEIYPKENELPSLASLQGMAPKATGNLDSVTFVRRLRDAEET